jgi:hypothetical protein
MKLNQLIIEATPGQLVKQMPDKLIAAWEKQTNHDLTAKEVMNQIVRLIPKEKTNTYVGWLTKQFIKGELNDITQQDIKDEVKQTLIYHSKAAQSDNNKRYADPETYKTFDDMYTSTMVGKFRMKSEAKSKKKSDNKEVWDNMSYKGSGAEIEEWIPDTMYRARSTRATFALGSPHWCVSHGDQPEEVRDNHCVTYSNDWDEDEPFFVLTLWDDERYGIYPGEAGSYQFVDYNNRSLDNEEIWDIFENDPEIYNLMKPYIRNTEWAPLDTSEPAGAYAQLERWWENNELSYMGDEVIDLEEIISTSARYSYEYAEEILDSERFPAGEKAIAGDTEYAYHYANNIIQGRWKPGEVVLRQDDILWGRYLEMLDDNDVHDDIESELQNKYHPDPQMPLFSESFKQIITEWFNS